MFRSLNSSWLEQKGDLLKGSWVVERIRRSLEGPAQARCPWGPGAAAAELAAALRLRSRPCGQSPAGCRYSCCRGSRSCRHSRCCRSGFPSLRDPGALTSLAGADASDLVKGQQPWLGTVSLWQAQSGEWERVLPLNGNHKVGTFSDKGREGGGWDEWQPDREGCGLECG